MKIYIPTRGRIHAQLTLKSLLPTKLAKDITLVAPRSEHKELRSLFDVNILEDAKGISATRQLILERHRKRFPSDSVLLMLDDDLSWRYRLGDDGRVYPKCTSAVVLEKSFALFEEKMQTHAHGSIGVAHFCTGRDLWTANSRMLRALAYNVRLMPKHARFRIPVMEDFDMALQLYSSGLGSITYNGIVQDQKSTNSPGGCSGYRTPKVQSDAAKALKKLWPEYVMVVEKKSNNWQGFEETRTDVRINWRRAYNVGAR